jgi:RluA family pseudouridine synthase
MERTFARALVVAGPERGLPLLAFLARRLKMSNRAAKRLLDERVVFVNDQRTWMARHPVAVGDRVELRGAASQAGATDLRILCEATPYLIVDKPAGLLSNGPNSTETRLREQLRDRDLWAVHRLDRETSGCLLFARGRDAFARMRPVFEERRVQKTYHAVVLGAWPADVKEIRKPIEGQTAATRVRLLRANPRASFLELQPETGRTHQLRRHLAGLGHPVVGDKTYSTGRVTDPVIKSAGRHLLHASLLAFPSPLSGEEINARSPLPGDFRRVMSKLGL